MLRRQGRTICRLLEKGTLISLRTTTALEKILLLHFSFFWVNLWSSFVVDLCSFIPGSSLAAELHDSSLIGLSEFFQPWRSLDPVAMLRCILQRANNLRRSDPLASVTFRGKEVRAVRMICSLIETGTHKIQILTRRDYFNSPNNLTCMSLICGKFLKTSLELTDAYVVKLKLTFHFDIKLALLSI